MDERQRYELHARAFAALSNPVRHTLFHYLVERPGTVSELADRAGVSRPNVSQHLAILSRESLVTRVRRDKRTEWQVTDARLAGACALIDQFLDDRLDERRSILSNDKE